jgi:hypothetical protein
LNFAQPSLKIAALAVIGDQRERTLVALCCFERVPEATQQIGARGTATIAACSANGLGPPRSPSSTS